MNTTTEKTRRPMTPIETGIVRRLVDFLAARGWKPSAASLTSAEAVLDAIQVMGYRWIGFRRESDGIRVRVLFIEGNGEDIVSDYAAKTDADLDAFTADMNAFDTAASRTPTSSTLRDAWTALSHAANAAARLSRRPGAPVLSADSSREDLLGWLVWNGYTDDEDGVWTAEVTLEGVWEEMARVDMEDVAGVKA